MENFLLIFPIETIFKANPDVQLTLLRLWGKKLAKINTLLKLY